ncbi:hypothetical protein PTMSG1_06564 [Pyrenophora teres f. maculata]|nr:hypothetical protein PTMSG1_06564 [Pyrenophora teres f. maculata]
MSITKNMAEPPTLLTLPREIRDQIFSYLYHEKRFKWVWKPFAEPSSFDLVILGLLYLHNSPQLSVLLTHSQLYAEHMPDFAVSIYANTSSSIMWLSMGKYACSFENVMGKSFLRRAKVITLFFPDRDRGSWECFCELVNVLTNIALEMKTLRIGTQISRVCRLESLMGNDDIDLEKMKQLGPSFITPLPKLTDLPLAQHCRAYRINANFPNLGCPDQYLVVLTSVDMLVYGREMTAKHKWTPQEVVKTLPLQEYRVVVDFTLGGWSPEFTERLRRFPLEMLEWKEANVNELKK